MFDDLNAILQFLLTCWDRFLLLYFGGGILSVVFAVWIIKKISRLFERLG